MIAGGLPAALLIPAAEKRAQPALPINLISSEPRGSAAQTSAGYELGDADRPRSRSPNVGRLCGDYKKQSQLRGRILGETGEVGRSVPMVYARHGRKQQLLVRRLKSRRGSIPGIHQPVVLIFAFRDVPEPFFLRRWSH